MGVRISPWAYVQYNSVDTGNNSCNLQRTVFLFQELGFFGPKTEILIYYISLPVLILSSFGTVFLAQHYFIDILGGVGMSLLAILLAMV